jgi:hypothetical protein
MFGRNTATSSWIAMARRNSRVAGAPEARHHGTQPEHAVSAARGSASVEGAEREELAPIRPPGWPSAPPTAGSGRAARSASSARAREVVRRGAAEQAEEALVEVGPARARRPPGRRARRLRPRPRRAGPRWPGGAARPVIHEARHEEALGEAQAALWASTGPSALGVPGSRACSTATKGLAAAAGARRPPPRDPRCPVPAPRPTRRSRIAADAPRPRAGPTGAGGPAPPPGCRPRPATPCGVEAKPHGVRVGAGEHVADLMGGVPRGGILGVVEERKPSAAKSWAKSPRFSAWSRSPASGFGPPPSAGPG